MVCNFVSPGMCFSLTCINIQKISALKLVLLFISTYKIFVYCGVITDETYKLDSKDGTVCTYVHGVPSLVPQSLLLANIRYLLP